MFKKIKNIFSNNLNNSHLLSDKQLENLVVKTKANVLKRNSQIDFDLLGRSLSCSPFIPRMQDLRLEYYLKDDKKIIKAMQIYYIEQLETLSSNLDLVVVDTTLNNDLSLISTIRRYSPYLIIHKDIIISKYQILESCIYGADMIILDGNVLDSNSLRMLFDFALSLGLVSILIPDTSCNIESYFDFIMLHNLEKLCSIPSDKFVVLL